ncbi:NADH dehydrogenase, alpha subcomplex, subunit 8 [Conidiobolus coronatus NRRL 28638]|uniref:NADH-ubiquinone oxidoreductase n=1 Tax=Conidiobolus coronatus (strain ATCC 28846 / CBS 209.66 / NRRL 28638) TaxID=796925 RepID=A0A137P836_CONC2|nr:NADH dehydrogenase, alpha subcomplex, subunit 8 [Conidiobolus coronatus NRRL 28638]|eukprot:KXN71091.1 NADH dehydrogenase, alpha subcomplex, subunit 8 [Conidiobolus coronatus NRRL 28638]
MSAGNNSHGTSAYDFRIDGKHVDPTPMPNSIPHVEEVGATSAPLLSASFFLGEYCRPYFEDFMLSKAENPDPAHSLKEGRKVTRCATDFLAKLKEKCGDEYEAHWKCLDVNNHEFYYCRPVEKKFNSCVLKAFNLKKTIPEAPEHLEPIHEKKNPIFY